jgi:predicted lipid-binding transport protein (Tim44 family)
MSGSEIWDNGVNAAGYILAGVLGALIAIIVLFIFVVIVGVLGFAVMWIFNLEGTRRPKSEEKE